MSKLLLANSIKATVLLIVKILSKVGALRSPAAYYVYVPRYRVVARTVRDLHELVENRRVWAAACTVRDSIAMGGHVCTDNRGAVIAVRGSTI